MTGSTFDTGGGYGLPWYVIIMAVALPHSALAGNIYTWTDAQGRSHYSDRPHPGAERKDYVPKPVATDATEYEEQRRKKRERLLNAFEQERREKHEAARKQERHRALKHRKCTQARDYLRILRESGQVYRLDDQGKRIYLSDAGREAAIQQAQANVEKWCD